MKAIGRLRQCGGCFAILCWWAAMMRRLSDRRVVRFWLLASALGLGFGSARLTAGSSLLTAAGSPTRRCTFLWILQVYIHSLCLWPGTEPGAAGVSLCLFNCFCGLSSVPGVGLKLDVDGPNFSDSIKGLLGFVYFVSWAQWIWKRAIYAGDSSHHSIAQM